MNIGKPAVFVRLAGCNLKCKWCDTAYARKGRNVEIGKIIAAIKKYPQCKHLVITGGEPMLQQEAIKALRREFADYYIEVETNGSQSVRCFDEVDLFTVSYKTSNSGNQPYKLKTKNKKCVYKFVVNNKRDFSEIEAVIKKYKLPADRVFLMPQGITRAAMLKNQDFIIEYCKKKGFNFSTRLHVLLGVK